MMSMYQSYTAIKIGGAEEPVGTGWLPPLPDLRDYTEEDADIPEMAKKLRIPSTKKALSIPATVDLRQW